MRILFLVVMLMVGCSSALENEARSDASPGSTDNAVNRVNFAGKIGRGTPGAERWITHGPYVAEQRSLPNAPEVHVTLVYRADAKHPMPVVVGFIPGDLGRAIASADKVTPDAQGRVVLERPLVEGTQKELLDRGVMLATIPTRDIPWPPDRPRWIWPTPDAAGVEFFITWAKIAPFDFGPLIDYLETRADVRTGKIGYYGFSATALVGYTLVANEPRINVAVLAGGAGDLKEFAAGWARNYDWADRGLELWPETVPKLDRDNPLNKAAQIAAQRKAILMINGGVDKIIPIEAARNFHAALRPLYNGAEHLCQLLVFEGDGHNLTYRHWQNLLLDWFDQYLIGD